MSNLAEPLIQQSEQYFCDAGRDIHLFATGIAVPYLVPVHIMNNLWVLPFFHLEGSLFEACFL